MLRLLAPVALAFVAIALMGVGLAMLNGGAMGTTERGNAVPAAHESEQAGHVEVGRYRLALVEIRAALDRLDRRERASFRSWDVMDVQPATASAMGTGGEHFFVNSFLVGYRPLRVDHPTLARAMLARRKTYTRDAAQYGGLADVWQTSRQAWAAPRGDCEDHALVLADWLIERGLDARVAVGTARGEGHAWVVVLDEGKSYLVEATDKGGRRRALPRAELVRGYAPRIQFNREHFWVNTGNPRTRAYRGEHWERRSEFVREQQRG